MLLYVVRSSVHTSATGAHLPHLHTIFENRYQVHSMLCSRGTHATHAPMKCVASTKHRVEAIQGAHVGGLPQVCGCVYIHKYYNIAIQPHKRDREFGGGVGHGEAPNIIQTG